MHIPPKEVVAIVGQTGAGKTTLVNLLFRYDDPNEGAILLDGRDIRTLTFKGLRQHMAIVLHTVQILHLGDGEHPLWQPERH